jgi:hypothetical protein
MSDERIFLREYTLADLFDRTIKMIRMTWRTSLPVGALAVLVPSVLLGVAFGSMMDGLARVAVETGESAGPEVLWRILQPVSSMWAAAALSGLLYLAAWLTVTHAVRTRVFGGSGSPLDSVSLAVRRSLLPVIGQSILKGLIVVAIIAIPSAILVLAVVVAEQPGFWAVPAGISYVVGIVAAVWVFVGLLFSSQAVVFQKAGVIGGLRDSMRLVRGSWWRVFGIYVLLQIIYSFAVGIISTPFVGVSAIPAVGEIIRMSTTEAVSDAEVMETLASFRSLGVSVAVSAFLQQLLGLIVLPVFYALFYVDLKIRSGELSSTEETHGSEE